MYLFVPANPKELTDRASWFKKPVARELIRKKDVQFGFELKGDSKNIKIEPPLSWGYHLPNGFSAEWHYHPEKRSKLLNDFQSVAALKPMYINLHGPKLWWKPKTHEYVRRYFNRSEPEEYFKVLGSAVILINELEKIFPNLTIENTLLCDYYRDEDNFLPMTSYQLNIGTLDDLFYLRQKTGVEILLDIEHLFLTMNFLHRKKNYRDLPIEKIEKMTEDEKKLKSIFGFYLRPGLIPYADEKVNFASFFRKVKAQKYHLTGSTQDIARKKDVTHGPIEKDDQTFRKNLRLVLKQNPEVLLIETANRGINSCYYYLLPNETELSFYNLCQILLEEL